MAASSYSTRFIHNTAQGFVRWTVPAGHRAVLKSILGYNGTSAVANIVLELKRQNIWFVAVPGFSGAASAPFMLPVYAGEEVGIYNQVVGVQSALSGYLFVDAGGGAIAGALPGQGGEGDPRPMPADDPLEAT